VLFGSPVGFFQEPHEVNDYARWLINCGYLTVTKGTTREALERTVSVAHENGMTIIVWNRIGAEAFAERFAGVPIDVYYFDEPGFPGPWLGRGYHQGAYRGYTDKYREAFNRHLRAKYDASSLRERFGLEGGVVKELPRDGLREELREGVQANPRLWYEFVSWHNRYVLDLLRDASAKVKKAVPGVATFPCLSPCYLEAGPRYAGVDYTLLSRDDMFERMQIDPYVHIRMNSEYWVSYVISMMRTACRDKPLDSWTCTWHGYGTEPIDMFQGPMCAFAHGVQGYCFWAYHHATQARWKPDYKERWFQIHRALRFIREHSDVTNYSPRNRVALYFPHQCYYIKYFDAPWTKHGGVWGSGYFAERTYYTLTRAHVPTDVVIPILGAESGLAEEVRKYKVIVLPEASYLSDTEVEMLRSWVAEGGTLISTGPLATHDQYGLPREEPALLDVTGVAYGAAKSRKFLKITRPGLFLPSFKPGTVVKCRGWPVKQYLSIDGAKVTYEGTGTHEQNMRTFRYAVDRLRGKEMPARSLEPKDGATVIGAWDDGSPALTIHQHGEGKVFACAAVDATVGYELSPWRDPVRVRLVGDLCRAGAELPRTGLPEEVEVNVLWGENTVAITLFNHGLAPVEPSDLSLPLPAAPSEGHFYTTEQDGALDVTHKNGRLTFRTPHFLDFLLCKFTTQGAMP